MRKLAELTATSTGPIAAEILRHAHELDVIAVFERSLYLMAPNGIVCLGLTTIGEGPINILVQPLPYGQPWAAGLDVETKAVTSNGRLTVGTVFTVDLARAVEWQPLPWPASSPQSLSRGVADLHRAGAGHLPRDGLAALVFAPLQVAARTSTAQAAAAQVRALGADMPKVIANDAWTGNALRAATLLVGLGPGLTPWVTTSSAA